MPINLHLTPTVLCKHPSIAGAFLIFLALVSAQPRLSYSSRFNCHTSQKSGNPSLCRRRDENGDRVLKSESSLFLIASSMSVHSAESVFILPEVLTAAPPVFTPYNIMKL